MHGARLTPQQQSTLVERIRRREAPAEEELVHLFSNRVAFLVRTRTRDPEAARDLTQEVLLAVVLALRNGHLREAERLAAFVYGTARNVINNYLRTRSRSPREDAIDDDLHPANHSQDPFEDAERSCPGPKCARRSGFRGSQDSAAHASQGFEARRNRGAPWPDVRRRPDPEVARAEKSDRAGEKAVTKMSEDTTNTSKRTMDCGRVSREEILEGYLAGRLTEEDREAFEEHYFECAHCFDELRMLQAIRDVLPEVTPESEPRRTHRATRWAPAAGLAAAAVLTVGTLLLMRPSSPSNPPESTKSTSPSPSAVPVPETPNRPPPAATPAPSLEQLARVDPPLYEPVRLRGAQTKRRSASNAVWSNIARLTTRGQSTGSTPLPNWSPMRHRSASFSESPISCWVRTTPPSIGFGPLLLSAIRRISRKRTGTWPRRCCGERTSALRKRS